MRRCSRTQSLLSLVVLRKASFRVSGTLVSTSSLTRVGSVRPAFAKSTSILGSVAENKTVCLELEEIVNNVQILSSIPGVGKSGKNLSKLITEAHLKQTIGLVKHDITAKITNKYFSGLVSC